MQKDAYKAARRYARALFESCVLADVERLGEELETFAKTFAESTELRQALLNPAVPVATQQKIISDVLQALTAAPRSPILNFVGLLHEAGRIATVELVSLRFQELIALARQNLSLLFVSATEVSEAQRSEILALVARECGSLASVTWQVDPSLVGGMIVRAGDLELDGSLLTALRRAQEALLGA